jgi:hypothetical protein
MATAKPRAVKLQCPFCTTISTRGTGLSSHIRSQHPREYEKWTKNPGRIADAAVATSPGIVSGKTSSARRAKPLRVDVTAGTAGRPPAEPSVKVSSPAAKQGARDGGGDDTRRLVQKAYDQLSARKHSIEAELARIEALRAEHEAVTARVAALDQALKAFQQQS